MKITLTILALAITFLSYAQATKAPGVTIYRYVERNGECITNLYLYQNGLYVEEFNRCGYGKGLASAGTWKSSKGKVHFSPGRYDSVFFKSVRLLRLDTAEKDHKCSTVKIYDVEGRNVTADMRLLYLEKGKPDKDTLPLTVTGDSTAILCEPKAGALVFDELKSGMGTRLKIPVSWPFVLNIRLSIPGSFLKTNELTSNGPNMDYDLLKNGNDILTDDGPGTISAVER